jgi:hypothetical protein
LLGSVLSMTYFFPKSYRVHWLLAVLGLWGIADTRQARAQSNDLSTAAMLSLLIRSDVRSRGMGEVGVALPNMSSALAVNPAMLLQPQWLSASSGGGGWLPQVQEDIRLHSRQITLSGRGLGFLMAAGASFTKVEQTTGGTTYFKEEISSYGVALAPHPKFSMGVAAKEVSSAWGPMAANKAHVWTYDGGVYLNGLIPQATFDVPTTAWLDEYNLPYESFWHMPRSDGFSIGMAVQNISEDGGDVTYSNGGRTAPLPRIATVGMSYRPINQYWISALFTVEMQRSLLDKEARFEPIVEGVGELLWDAVTLQSKDGDVIRWGFEFTWVHMVDVRVGHSIDPQGDLSPWTLGLGFGLDKLQLNWAHTFQSDLGPVDGTDFWGIALRF